jgi:uncharacterized protein (DUF2062 family)
MPRKTIKRLVAWSTSKPHSWYMRLFGKRIADAHLFTMNRHAITAAFGTGLAISFIPLPVHTLLAIIVSVSRRLNLPVAIAATWVVNPLTAVPIYYGAYRVGALLINHPVRHFAFQLSWRWMEHGLGPVWKPFLLGCLVSGIIAGLLGRWVLELVWRWYARRRYRLRHQRRSCPSARPGT